MAAAALAHRGLRRCGHVQIGAASEAADSPRSARRLTGLRLGSAKVLKPKMLAAHDDGTDVHITVYDCAVTQLQSPVGVDLPFEFAFQGQFAGKPEIPFDFDVRTQNVFRRIRCSIHNLVSCGLVTLTDRPESI